MRRRIKRVFLDYASSTPLDQKVLQQMMPYFSINFGNPSSYYHEGLISNKAINDARKSVSTIVGVKPHEVIFTGSGTEANNLIIFGLLNGVMKSDHLSYEKWKKKVPNILTSVIEHPSILEPCKEVVKNKMASVQKIKVLESGIIDFTNFKENLNEETLLISIILANNEIGTIQPIREISSEVKKFKNKIGRSFNEPPFIHTDASQAPNFLDVNLNRLGIHAMTIDASKIYGPKGVGCLIKKSYLPISPIMFGGNQEFNLRPATENVPLIVGLAKSLEIAQKNLTQNFQKMEKLQRYFIQEIRRKIPSAMINGSIKKRLPNNLNICIKGLDSEFAVIRLDEAGLSCSATTACKGFSGEGRSHVVDSLYLNSKKLQDCGKSSLRFSMGKNTKKRDIDFAIKCLFDII